MSNISPLKGRGVVNENALGHILMLRIKKIHLNATLLTRILNNRISIQYRTPSKKIVFPSSEENSVISDRRTLTLEQTGESIEYCWEKERL